MIKSSDLNKINVNSSHVIPTVDEQVGMTERRYDIFSRLLKDRIIFLAGEVSDALSDLIIAQFLFLESQDTKRDINLYINSPGGSVTAGLAIYDTMQYIKCDIQAICIGQAASMGAVLLAGATKGKRFALPSSRIMIHQPSGGAYGQATDISIQAKEIKRLKNLINSYMSQRTGQKLERIEQDMERDYFMTAQESLEYGIIDKILTREDK